jgi:hypothetical protein
LWCSLLLLGLLLLTPLLLLGLLLLLLGCCAYAASVTAPGLLSQTAAVQDRPETHGSG